VSGILLIYLLTIIPFSDILSSLKSAEISLVLTGIILTAPIAFFSALETQYIMKVQGMTLTVVEILKINLATNFYGLFLPGTLSGGAIKWYKLSQFGSKSSAAAVVVFNRFLEILMIVLIGMLFYFPPLYTSGNHKLAVLWVLLFLFMVTLYLLLLNKPTIDYIEKIILNILLHRIIKEKLCKFIRAMKQFQNIQLKDHFQIIGLLFFYHGIGIISFYCFAKSLNIDVNIWVIGWVRSAIFILVMIPLSVAGLGIREGILVFLLGQYGVLPNDSMALSFLFFTRNLLYSSVGAFFEFKEFAFNKKIKEIKSDL
jgi:uncharacterized protein (TIRG00374 family)